MTYLDIKTLGGAVPHTWDPERYLTYADERGRPFVELLARVGAERAGAPWSTSAAGRAT